MFIQGPPKKRGQELCISYQGYLHFYSEIAVSGKWAVPYKAADAAASNCFASRNRSAGKKLVIVPLVYCGVLQ